jgi:hypothetical protein
MSERLRDALCSREWRQLKTFQGLDHGQELWPMIHCSIPLK